MEKRETRINTDCMQQLEIMKKNDTLKNPKYQERAYTAIDPDVNLAYKLKD